MNLSRTSLIILALFFSNIGVFQTFQLRAANGPIPTEIYRDFHSTFYEIIVKHRIDMSSQSRNVFDRKLRMAAEKASGEPNRLPEARESVIRMAYEVVLFAEQRGGRSGESTWPSVRRLICPLWPFCQ